MIICEKLQDVQSTIGMSFFRVSRLLINLHGCVRSPRNTRTVCTYFENVCQEWNTTLGRIQDLEKGDLDTERRGLSPTGTPEGHPGASFSNNFLKLRSSKME